MKYQPHKNRYNQFNYNRCGNSGILLPPITLGLWHNFGGKNISAESKKMIFRAFDRGVTHFDLGSELP